MPFHDDYVGWRYASCVIAPKKANQSKTISSITVITAYDYNINGVAFDKVSLRQKACTTHTYDNLDRVTHEYWNNTLKYQYFYNSEGNLAKKLDVGTEKAVNYEYDSLGRLIHSSQTVKEDEITRTLQWTEHIYDTENRIKSQSWQFGSTAYSESYTYSTSDGSLSSMTTKRNGSSLASVTFAYDALKRLSTRQIGSYKQTYTYRDRDNDTAKTTTQVAAIQYTSPSAKLSYAYDSVGNIASVTATGLSALSASYTYDQQGQLTKEVNANGTYNYTFDTYGNIRSVSGAESHTYTYGDSNWLDLLTVYDGKSITYDAIGNPQTWRNDKADWTFTWQNGRQLSSAKSGKTNVTTTYTYDVAGIRDSKKVGSTTYEYITQNGQVVRQTGGGHTLDFVYDNQGRPMTLVYDGTAYTYMLNLQGDVIALLNSSGGYVAKYVYDAWGKVLSSTGTLAEENPLRYRGYYYDTESELYYLGSRYYDPAVKRFINADTLDILTVNTYGLTDKNLFSYCDNNPVLKKDDGGYLPTVVVGAIVGAGLNLAQSLIAGDSVGETIKSTMLGAASGALEASLGGAASVIYGAVTNGWSAYREARKEVSSGKLTVAGAVAKVASSAAVGALFSASGLGGKTEKLSSLKTLGQSYRKVISNRKVRGTVYKTALNTVKTYASRSGKQLARSFASGTVSTASTRFSGWYVGKYVTWATR